jgi:hypothetical protein
LPRAETLGIPKLSLPRETLDRARRATEVVASLEMPEQQVVVQHRLP